MFILFVFDHWKAIQIFFIPISNSIEISAHKHMHTQIHLLDNVTINERDRHTMIERERKDIWNIHKYWLTIVLMHKQIEFRTVEMCNSNLESCLRFEIRRNFRIFFFTNEKSILTESVHTITVLCQLSRSYSDVDERITRRTSCGQVRWVKSKYAFWIW